MKRIPVADLMEKEPVSVRPDTPLGELVASLQRYKFRALPVTGEDGRLLGVVSETDLFLKEKGVPFSLEKVPTLLGRVVAEDELQNFGPARKVKIEEVMTANPVSIAPDATLEEAAMLMYQRRFSVLPVVEGGKLVGMVRRIDLLRRIYAVV